MAPVGRLRIASKRSFTFSLGSQYGHYSPRISLRLISLRIMAHGDNLLRLP